MSNHYCPFNRDLCDNECVFRQRKYALPTDCVLYNAAVNASALYDLVNTMDDKLTALASKVSDEK